MAHTKARKKTKIRNRCNQVPHLIQDTTWESEKTHTRKHHIKEGQDVIPFQASDHKPAMNRQDSMTDTKHKSQKRSTKEAHAKTQVTSLLC